MRSILIVMKITQRMRAYIQVIVLLLEAQLSNNYSSYFLKTSN